MKVAVDVSAIPARPAGAGVYVLRLVEALAASGAVRLHELVAPSCPVLVAPHGVDHDRFRPDGPRTDLGFPYVLFVGTLEPRKNVPGLVRAMSRLDPDIRLVLAGRPGWGAAEVDD